MIMRSLLPRFRILLLHYAAALIVCHSIFPFRDDPQTFGRVVDAFRPSSPLFRSRLRNEHGLLLGYKLQSSRLHQQPSSSSQTTDSRAYKSKFPQNLPRKRRRKNGSGRSNNTAFRSRALLNSFEKLCQREKRNSSLRGEEFVELLDSMVNDLLEGKDILMDGETISESEQSQNLSDHILPRDASSLIRLLGRNGAHDAMLQFCQRYCRDILDRSEGGSGLISQVEAEEAILFAYTAAIAACSKPPPTSLASSKEPYITTNYSKYRSKSFLLSLLDEMEHGYTEDGRSIRPNSYTLSAVLLGIDDVNESMDVLEDFEAKYKKQDDDDEGEHTENIVTVQVYNVVIASCSKTSSNNKSGWQRALSILQRMRTSGPQPNEQTYSLILQACAEDCQMKVAASLLDEIRQSPTVKPTTKLYLPLMKVCAKYGNSKMAWSLIGMMRDDSLELTTEIMNMYLSALAKNKQHTRALGVLQDMIADPSMPPDIITFNSVLAACANAGDYEGAQALLDQMKDGLYEFPIQGANGKSKLVEIKPDVVSYNTVISCSDPETALSFIQEMKLTRRNRVGVITPNSVSYVNAISQCRKASFEGDPNYAFEIAMYLLDLAREENNGKGIDLNVYVYSSSIWMAEAVHDYRTAVQLLREMKCAPNNICYDGVISALSHHGLHREALYFYYEMQHLGLPATRKTYQRLVFAINNTRDPELSMSSKKKAALLDGVLSVMPETDRRIQIGGPLFESLIKNHGNMTDPGASYQAARRVFDSIVGPVDERCLAAMLYVCSSAVKWNEALMLIHSSDIVNKPSGPGLVSNRALGYAVMACAKANQWEEALTIMDLYGHQANGIAQSKNKGGVVSVSAINSVIRACGRSARPDMAVQILNDMPVKYGVQPDEKSYAQAIIACNQAEHRNNSEVGLGLQWWECALSLLRRMTEEDIEPSLQTFSSVVSACEAAGQWQRAIGVLKLMPSFSSILGDDEDEGMGTHEPANLYCLNAAISACEKGGAWVEALQLYETVRSQKDTENAVTPNFITVNSLLIALDKANQLELAQAIYKDAVRERVVMPWKRRYDNDGNLRKMMDLHQFSAPMAKIAVRSYLESLLISRRKNFDDAGAVFIVGKGKGSEGRPVLMSAILQLLNDDYDIDATIDETNKGRIRVTKESIEAFIGEKQWKFD